MICQIYTHILNVLILKKLIGNIINVFIFIELQQKVLGEKEFYEIMFKPLKK
jgi:hypothetical protein